ncbi:GNAT family N-acetyltransferase [Evansella cellulosilytica]|uniref:GCN5-related N-acetyltransferase n=1 Tax=Evansella cellulosilytica (strain ATCC 21833 / DSM 2522 / FERM P-1141 / JCM 9156 / N-4) TaxID=649639 RepID=E6TRY8_EVAC2|nr:GNAT family N-acetyltransferase [Evansella cellulosilytica]ADU30642.1 GCN5-related N-acetyltransferase [Evansella cellulosilytica DSM 2522]
MEIITDYKFDDKLRASFFELAYETFGIKFESWYEYGFWTSSYIPVSYVDEGRVVANVSMNTLELIISGKKMKAVQLGTVMTDPLYRNRGLASELVKKVINEHEHFVDIFYLFANKSVLDFYPRFGFKRVDQYQYSMDFCVKNIEYVEIKKLGGSKTELAHLYSLATNRTMISERFGTLHTEGIFMFYCLNVFPNDIYYLVEEDVIIIYHHSGSELEVFDIVSKYKVDVLSILSKIASEQTKRVIFHFTPDFFSSSLKSTVVKDESSVLFVKAKSESLYPEKVYHPITAQA